MITLREYALRHKMNERAYYRKLKIPIDISSDKIIINDDGTWTKVN